MAIAIVGHNSGSTNGSSSAVVPLPAGIAAGDVVLLALVRSSPTTYGPTPSGWTMLTEAANANSATAIFGIQATGAMSSVTPNWTDPFAVGYSAIVLRGASFASIVAQATTTSTAPALSIPAGGLYVSFGTAVDTSAGVGYFAPFTQLENPSGAASGRVAALATYAPTSAGTYGPYAVTTNGSAGAIAGLSVAQSNLPPNAPTLGSPANNATLDRAATQRFAWTFSDPNPGDSQSAFDLQYRLVGGSTWTTVSGTTPNAFYDFAAATFAAGNYEWQVRTYDSQGLVGPWSSSSFFTAASAPAQPTITAPVNGATVPNTATLTWSAPNQTDYEVRRVADNAGSADTSTIYSDTGDVVDATTRSITVTFDTNNRWEHVQVRIKNGGLWSTWADARVQVSYTPPTVATFTMAPDPTTAARTLTITNPAPGGGVPATAYNDVYCRTAASSTVLDTYRPYSATGVRIATALATNTPWVDRTPAGSPVVYEYRVVSMATNGTTSDSGWQATP